MLVTSILNLNGNSMSTLAQSDLTDIPVEIILLGLLGSLIFIYANLLK